MNNMASPLPFALSQEKHLYRLFDIMGNIHLLMVQERIFLDDVPVTAVAIQEQQIILERFPSFPAVTCTLEALWESVGTNRIPTPEDAGRLVAHILRLCMPLSQVSTVVGNLPHMSMPQFHLESWVEQVLQVVPSTPTRADVQALARILHQPEATIVAWLQQRGKSPVDDTEGEQDQLEKASPEQEMSPHSREALVPLPGAPQPGGQEQADPPYEEKAPPGTRFRWSDERKEALKQALASLQVDLAASSTSVQGVARTIAQQKQWPYAAVELKLRKLRRHLQQKKNRESQEQEDDQPGGSSTTKVHATA
jgi:hypothetical protein